MRLLFLCLCHKHILHHVSSSVLKMCYKAMKLINCVAQNILLMFKETKSLLNMEYIIFLNLC